MKKIIYCLLLLCLLFINALNLNASTSGVEVPGGWSISQNDMTCEELLGTNLTKIVHLGVTIVKVVAASTTIICGIFYFYLLMILKN